MSRIFLSYNQRDRDIVTGVSEELRALGHEITVDVDSLYPGQDWRKVLSTGLRESEVCVVFISEHALASTSVMNEMGAARAYSEESGRMLLLPVLIENIAIPSSISDILYISGVDATSKEIAEKINGAVAHFAGATIAKDEKQEKFSKIVEENSGAYIQDAIEIQKGSELLNRNFAMRWYMAGFVALLLGLVFVVHSIASISASESSNWPYLAVVTLKSFLAIGLLGACSKYAFTLGKSYMSESLKSSDRIHAISFGKFYLKVYGAKATWPEIQQAFQHWNIDRTSVFSSIGSADFDPKLLEGLLEFGKAFAAKSTERK